MGEGVEGGGGRKGVGGGGSRGFLSVLAGGTKGQGWQRSQGLFLSENSLDVNETQESQSDGVD